MSRSKINVPEAKEAMERFKMEAANEVGVNLKQGYNGDLTSRQAGSIGGQMVNNICPVRQKFSIAITAPVMDIQHRLGMSIKL